jgi:hypothetical protein
MNNEYALFMGWKRSVPGREMDSIELFGGFNKYLDTLKDNGTITSHTPYFLDSHGGDLNGFWLINGDRTKLDEMTHSDEWMTYVAKGMYTMEGFGVIRAQTGAALQNRMGKFQSVIKK